MMLRLLITISSLSIVGFSFIFRDDQNHPRCYELDLENCFREAFLVYLSSQMLQYRRNRRSFNNNNNQGAIHPPMFSKRSLPSVHSSGNSTVLDKRKRESDPAHLQTCHDVRKFSGCFVFPGCSDQTAANIASVQYHMVFGKKLPMNVFLAYRGYGKQLCDQQCSKENVMKCRRGMDQTEQQDEQGYLLEISTILGHIQPNRDVTVACKRFNKVLINLLRLRSNRCGDTAKCTCSEVAVQQGVDGCESGCEHLLQLDLDALAAINSNSSRLKSFYFLIICFYFIFLVMY